jgi:hypothetical protein
MMRIFTAIFFLFFSNFLFAQQLQNENLIQAMPDGYKIDFQTRKGNMLMTEMVPVAESVKNWNEMVTTQVFLGLKTATPSEFRDFMMKQLVTVCPKGGGAPITEGVENGYPFAVWLQACPKVDANGKPENTFFKAIKGNDSLYVVQKAFKFDPTPEQMTTWVTYLKSIQVCDTRIPERACKQPNN